MERLKTAEINIAVKRILQLNLLYSGHYDWLTLCTLSLGTALSMEQQTVTYSNTKSCFHVDVEQQAGLFCAPTICFFFKYTYMHMCNYLIIFTILWPLLLTVSFIFCMDVSQRIPQRFWYCGLLLVFSSTLLPSTVDSQKNHEGTKQKDTPPSQFFFI